MKKIVVIVTLILCQFGFSQSYEFDYIIEYKSILKDSIGKTVFYLTNSKDNQYRAALSSIDEQTFGLSFYKHGRINSFTTIKKSDFYKYEIINIEDNYYKPRSIGKVIAKKVHFINLKDTIVDNKPYKRYVFYQNPRKHNLRVYYTIVPSTEFHVPILSSADSYIEWALEKNIPNGIYNEIYYLDEKGKMVEAHYN